MPEVDESAEASESLDVGSLIVELDSLLKSPDGRSEIKIVRELRTDLSGEERIEFDRLYEVYAAAGLDAVQNTIVVCFVHGIRTEAAWHSAIDEKLGRRCSIHRTYLLKYRDYRLWHFVSHPIFVGKRYDGVLNQLKEILRRHENKRVVVIAHSFGTVVALEAFQRLGSRKIDGVIFCGSIAQEDYDWLRLKCVNASELINDCGDRDMLPVIANLTSLFFGKAGHSGFGSAPLVVNRFHDLGHSDFFDANFVKEYWLPYIESGFVRLSGRPKSERSPMFNRIISLTSLAPALVIICIVLWGIYTML